MAGSRLVHRKRTAPKAEPEIQLRFRIDILVWAMLGAAVLASVLARREVIGFHSADYRIYLTQWYAHLRAGGYPEFATAFADYNFPYLYLLYVVSLFNIPALVAIKGISIFFDYLMAFGVWWLVKGVRPSARYLPAFAAVTTLLLPSVILDSAAWGQAEAIYVSFMILSLGLWVRGRFSWAWLLFGVAFSIKLQAIFLLPLLAVLWLVDRRQRLWTPLLFLVAPVLAPIPAVLVGRSVVSAYGVYADQASRFFMTRTANALTWLNVDSQRFGDMFLALTLAVLLISVAGFLLRHKGRPRADSVLAMAAFVTLTAPFLLPTMRDRYSYAGELLTLVWAFIAPRTRVWLPLLVSVPMTMLYSRSLFHVAPPIGFAMLSLSLLVAIVVLGMDAFRSADASYRIGDVPATDAPVVDDPGSV